MAVIGISALLEELAVRAVFAVLRAIDEVTVFAVASASRIVAILVTDGHHTHLGDISQELTKLREEWSREVEVPTVRKRIPLFRMPLIESVDFSRNDRVFVIDSDDVFAREIGLSFVEIAFVPLTGSEFQSALRALLWSLRMDDSLPEGENHFLRKSVDLWIRDEGCATEGAGGGNTVSIHFSSLAIRKFFLF